MTQAPVLVTGGTGQLGRVLVRALLESGATVRVLTRQVPAKTQEGAEYAVADYAAGTGLTEALAGVRSVIHTAHIFGDPLADAQGTLNVLEAARAAGRPHFTFVSIVGARRATRFGYYAGKVRGEELVEASGLPHLIFRATQFHSFVDGVLGGVGRLPWLPVPDGTLQPVAVREVAHELAAQVLAGREGTFDLAGPEVLALPDLARLWLGAQGRPGRVLPLRFPIPQPFLRAIQRGVLTEPGAARGHRTWAEYLAGRYPREQAARG